MERIIIPLDGFENMVEICDLVTKIQEEEFYQNRKIIWGFKVNDALLNYGVDIIAELKSEGFRVFADPKLHDIHNTISNSLKLLIEAESDIISVHASAQYDPSNEEEANKLAGITVLTSLTQDQCYQVYNGEIYEVLEAFKTFIHYKKYGYMVCSSKDLLTLDREKFKDTKIITPGIRPSWYEKKDDQSRISTPEEAIKNGADLLVIGRPILESSDVIKTINLINEEIEGI